MTLELHLEDNNLYLAAIKYRHCLSHLIIDSIFVLITVFVLWSILHLPRWYEKSGRHLQQASRLKRGFKLAGVGLRLVWELILPA